MHQRPKLDILVSRAVLVGLHSLHASNSVRAQGRTLAPVPLASSPAVSVFAHSMWDCESRKRREPTKVVAGFVTRLADDGNVQTAAERAARPASTTGSSRCASWAGSSGRRRADQGGAESFDRAAIHLAVLFIFGEVVDVCRMNHTVRSSRSAARTLEIGERTTMHIGACRKDFRRANCTFVGVSQSPGPHG